jgi:hypothetical protein
MIKDGNNFWLIIFSIKIQQFILRHWITQKRWKLSEKIITGIILKEDFTLFNILFNRWTIKNAHISSVWSAIEYSLNSVLLELFDDYDLLNDAEQDLSLYLDYPNHNSLNLLLSSFEKNDNLFKRNYVKLLETVERLILMGKFLDASQWMHRLINKQLASVNISPLIHAFIRICSSLTNSTDIEPRNLFCSTIL